MVKDVEIGEKKRERVTNFYRGVEKGIIHNSHFFQYDLYLRKNDKS